MPSATRIKKPHLCFQNHLNVYNHTISANSHLNKEKRDHRKILFKHFPCLLHFPLSLIPPKKFHIKVSFKMPIFCWVFQTEGAKMKTFSRLLQAKPFRMGSNAEQKKRLVLFLEISNMCCLILSQLWTILNLKLFRICSDHKMSYVSTYIYEWRYSLKYKKQMKIFLKLHKTLPRWRNKVIYWKTHKIFRWK